MMNITLKGFVWVPFLAVALAGCTTPPAYVEHTLPYRTVRFPGGNYSALAVSNGLAVTSSHWTREDCGGVFDISSPTNIRLLLRYPCKGYSCSCPVFFGERCYVPNMFSISVLNLKDRANPKFEAVINPQFPNHGGDQLWVTGGALYFKAGKDVFKVRPDGISFDRVEGVKPPKAVSVKKLTDERGRVVSIEGGALTVDGHELPFAYDLSSLAVADGIAWVYAPCHSAQAALLPVATGGGRIYAAPRVPAETVARTNAYQTMGMQTASSVTRVGDLLFADDGIAKLGRKGEATFVRRRTRAASNMSVDGKRIAIAQCAYCRLMDFSDLDRVKTVDFAPPADRPLHLTGCALEGKRLYVCYTLKESPKMDFIYQQPDRGFVASYDTDDPSRPLSVIETPACIAMAKVGGFLYVTGRKGDFLVVDATDAKKLRLADVRHDLQLGQAFKVKRFEAGVFLLNGRRVIELDVSDPAQPRAVRIFDRGANRAAPGYDDFTVEGGWLYALAHASVDMFPLKGCRLDPVVDDCGAKGVDAEALEPADAALFAGHVRRTRPPAGWTFEAGRFGNSCGAYVYDWARLADGTYAVAYGEAGVVLCDRIGRFRAELPAGADGWSALFATAVLERDGDVYVQDAAGRAYRAFRNVLGDRRDMKGRWCSLGTSITWYNDNVDVASGRFTRGYQDRVLEKLRFTGLENAGISGGCVGGQYVPLAKADYYTVEHGINDWGKSTPVGTFGDYVKNAKNGTFYANYRVLVDKIRAKNPAAQIILCTPRKGYGFGTYLPPRCDDAKKGVRLSEYAEAVRAIAAHEKLPVADFYATCGEQDELAGLSIDVALHPNDAGYQRMADELVRAFGTLQPREEDLRISVFAKFIRMTAKERGISLQAAADLLYEAGVRGYDCGPDEDDLDELAKTKLRAINFYYFPDWFGIDQHDWNPLYADRTTPEDCLGKAKRYGVPRIMVVPPWFTDGKENEPEFATIVAKMRAFVAAAKAEGIDVTIEDFGSPGNCCSRIKYLKRLMTEIPDLKFALDTGNLYYAGLGEDILEMMAFAKGRIGHVHLKDQTASDNHEYVTLGQGAVPNETVVRSIRDGYTGWYTLENPVGDTYDDTVRQVKRLKEWLR